MKNIELKNSLTVKIRVFYYDKNSAEKYCTKDYSKTFFISEDLKNYFADKNNLKKFIRSNELFKVIIFKSVNFKSVNKEYNTEKVKAEMEKLEGEIVDIKNEALYELKRNKFSFVKVAEPHEVLNPKKYEEQEKNN